MRTTVAGDGMSRCERGRRGPSRAAALPDPAKRPIAHDRRRPATASRTRRRRGTAPPGSGPSGGRPHGYRAVAPGPAPVGSFLARSLMAPHHIRHAPTRKHRRRRHRLLDDDLPDHRRMDGAVVLVRARLREGEAVRLPGSIVPALERSRRRRPPCGPSSRSFVHVTVGARLDLDVRGSNVKFVMVTVPGAARAARAAGRPSLPGAARPPPPPQAASRSAGQRRENRERASRDVRLTALPSVRALPGGAPCALLPPRSGAITRRGTRTHAAILDGTGRPGPRSSRRDAEQTRRPPLALPADARRRPRRLVSVGRGGVRGRARARRPDLPVERLRVVPLVPRDAARVLQGPGHRRAPQRRTSCR